MAIRTEPSSPFVTDAARRIARRFPSFRDFVDDALFHPRWGYYSTGKVRFGEGGHYDTFPLALAPLFGRMVAGVAYRFWRRSGRPARFELCELGAGNGQLCMDVHIAMREQADRSAAWRRFAAAFRYRIIERSPALIARQREHLGPVARRVRWTQADLTQRTPRGLPFAPCGLVFANEVLDCLAHHKVVPQKNGQPGVVFVVPELEGRPVSRRTLARIFAKDRLGLGVEFREEVLPVALRPAVHEFLWRYYPEFFKPGNRFKPYFACPEIETLIRNTARLYRTSQMLWIDYGDTSRFHLIAPESQRVFAGPPRSGASVYRAPGLDDITFSVDFSVVGAAAEDAGLRVRFYGGQGELARRSGVALDRSARALILQYRMLGWLLSVVGVGPERSWRHTSLTWSKRDGHGGRIRDDVNKSVAEFLGKRSSNFKLMILERKAGRRA